MNVRQKLQEVTQKWEAAINDGDLAAAKSFKAEAENLQELLAQEEALVSARKSIPDPVRPPLPGTPVAQDTGSVVKTAEPKQEEAQIAPSLKAAYATRFGNAEDMVKGILKDIHGSDYEAKYWAQRVAFRRYLRSGDKEMSHSDVRLLREVVMNPAAVKAALNEGVDDVASLKSTMVEAADTLGGYVVPVDFQMKVIERMRGLTIMRGRATTNTTSRDRVEMPEITGGSGQYSTGVRGKWVDETPTAGTAETNLTFGMRGIPIYTYMAETPISRNMVEDSAFDVEGYLSKKFAETTAIDEDNAFLTGDGVGKPQGLLPGGANSLSLTRVASGGASTLTWDGLISAPYALDAQYRQTGSVWIGNKATYEAIAKLKDANYGYLWDPYQFNGGEGGVFNRPLLGYNTLEQEAMPSVAAGTFPLLFGNPSGYHIYDRIGMTVERFLDASTARQNLVYYVMRRRVGGQPVERWQFVVVEVAAS